VIFEKFRNFADAIPNAFLVINPRDSAIIDVNVSACRTLGKTRPELVGQLLTTLTEADEERLLAYLRLCASSISPLPGSLVFRDVAEPINAWRVDGFALQGQMQAGVLLELRGQQMANAAFRLLNDRVSELTTEVGRRKVAEEHQELLINELNHRVKNMLAVVQSICTLTLRNSGVEAPTRALLDSRLTALAGSHDLLTREHWTGADLGDVITQALIPFRLAGQAHRISIAGQPIHLRPKQAVALGMVLHELATNALKYGALSNGIGSINVNWTEHNSMIQLKWEESGGPTVAKPTHKGFGSRLIERSFPSEIHGSVKVSYDPAGLVCEIDIPSARGTSGESS
jgi:two-component sensor histidine kinase